MSKKAFTLAEVLITLGIIGVVAAMTLPTLVQKYRKIIVENQLKQAYSLISNAVKWAEVENGIGFEITTKNFDDVNNVNGFSYEHSEAVFEKYFKKHFKITQSYNKTDSQKYFKYRGQTTRTYISPGYAKCYKLTNGQGLCYIARGGDQMGYFYIYLKPDKLDKVVGRDVFSLEFTRKNNVFKVYQLIQDSYKESNRTQYINGCISENEYPIGSLPRVMICTFLIWNNNFKIPKDYPIIF